MSEFYNIFFLNHFWKLKKSNWLDIWRNGQECKSKMKLVAPDWKSRIFFSAFDCLSHMQFFFCCSWEYFHFLHYILYYMSALNNENILFILKRGWCSASYPFSKFVLCVNFHYTVPKFEVFTRYNALLYKINTFVLLIIWLLFI